MQPIIQAVQVLGVTGNIGSGKSTVCRLLRERGCPTIDADKEAHKTYRHGTDVWRDIVATFGPDVLDAAGEIDRGSLGRMVFSDAASRERLNTIVHPATRSRVEDFLAQCSRQGHEWAAVEATLLIEAGWHDMVDRIWLVASPENLVIQRLLQDRNQAKAVSRARIAAQMSAREKMQHADDIIYNDGTPEDLEERVSQLWRNLICS
ncbi:MAG: dephospho-CoA kinase [Dehalococcoidia bacterium]|nr:dephospho-CoA kinase [Dehalococcoidia bacterium]